MIKKIISILLLVSSFLIVVAQSEESTVKLGLLKYKGGGDWYANPTSLPNLLDFYNKTFDAKIISQVVEVEAGSEEIFNYPFIHMTGHGNVVFSEKEVENLRTYLLSGGFLHVDDNYGMDKYIRRELKKIFPESDLVELPLNHPLYSEYFVFEKGLPKIHEHDKKAPQGFAIVHEGRIVVYYTYECDLGDGWEDEDVHNDSFDTRQKALQMGVNLLSYCFQN